MGLTFWVSRQIPNRTQFIKTLQRHGGTILDKESENSYNLINPEKNKSNTTSACHDYKFVLDSLEQKRLLDESNYEVRDRHPVSRVAGSTSTLQKGTRTKFTPEDDQIVYDWVEPLRLAGGPYKGNKIYEQLAELQPHHTFQSWRDRYLNYLEKSTHLKVTERMQPDPDVVDENIERPAKRRRMNGNTTTASQRPKLDGTRDIVVDSIEIQPNHRPSEVRRSPNLQSLETSRQDDRAEDHPKDQPLFCTPDREVLQALPHDRYSQTSIGVQGFEYEEANGLYAAVPAICNTSPEKLKQGWITMADTWKGHTVDEWKTYYKDYIFPEYRRANGIETQDELDAHIAGIEAQKYSSSPLEEDAEQIGTSDLKDMEGRSVHDVQGPSEHSVNPIAEEMTNKADLQDYSVTEPENQTSSGSNSKSSTQRVGITANEGRKRVTQQMNVESAHSPLVPPPTTPPSQKKRLFGRVLELSGMVSQLQPSLVTQLETTDVQINVTSSVPIQSNISSTGKTNGASSSSSVPMVYKPPQSFQIPPMSLSTSQESANYETALQLQANSTKVNVEPVLPEHIIDLDTNDEIDLLDGERTDSEPDLAENPLSDTGSEYIAFETEIERSQMWETESQFDGEVTDPSDDEDPQDKSRSSIRPATSPKQRAPAEWTEDSDEGADHTPELPSRTHAVQHQPARVETQALFEKPIQGEFSIFDLPDPDGGWETLGIIEDPDEAIDTIELSENHPLKQRQSLSLNESLEEPFHTQNSPIVIAQTHVVAATPSVRVGGGANTRRAPSIHVKNEQARIQGQDVQATRLTTMTPASVRRAYADSDVNPDVSTISTIRFGHDGTLASWMVTQQEKYHELPELVLMRLASTASQAINLNSITTATLLLKTLVDSFLAYEHHRQADYKQQNPGTRKRLKPVTSLTSAQAKDMLPNDIRGVWTPEDDDRLTSSSRVSIMLNENKHGVDGVKERISFLRSRYNLKDGSSPMKGVTMTPGASSSKRTR